MVSGTAIEMGIRITLTARFPDVHTGEEIDVRFDRDISGTDLSIMDENLFIQMLWMQYESAILHEAQERFTVKGERPKAPEHS